MLTLQQAVFMQQNFGLGPQPVTDTIYGWGQYKDQVKLLPKPEQDKVDQLADLIVKSFAQSDWPPFRKVAIVGHADKDWHGAGWEDTVSFNRAMAVQEALTSKVLALWAERNMGPPPPGGVDWAVDNKGATQLIAPAYNPKNRRVEVILTRSGAPIPPPPDPDTFARRVGRAAKLIEEGKKVQPDGPHRTQRAFCLLTKLLAQVLAGKVNDAFVDGRNSNETVNGRHALNEQGMPTSLCGFPGWWDPPEVTGADWNKFFFNVMPILNGPGWAPDQSDETILNILGDVVLTIDNGILLTDQYIARKGAGGFGYAGDQTRKKLQTEYVRRMDDENDIYSCFKSKMPF